MLSHNICKTGLYFMHQYLQIWGKKKPMIHGQWRWNAAGLRSHIIMIIMIMINDHDNDSNHSNHCNYDSNYYENCENVSSPRSKMVGGVNYGLVLSFHVNNDHLK